MSMTITSLESASEVLSLRLIEAEFESVLEGAATQAGAETGAAQPAATSDSGAASAQNAGQSLGPPSQVADPSPSAAPPTQSAAPSQGAAPSTQGAQALMSGDFFDQSPQSAKAPSLPNVSTSQLMDADGGLLEKTGDQKMKGKGAKDLKGGIDDELAEEAGGKPGDIGKNKDVTERALMIEESGKDMLQSNGQMLPASIRHNGNMSGIDKSGKIMNGGDLSVIQNIGENSSFKISSERPASMGMNSNDTEKNGAHKFWDENKKWLLPIAELPLMAVPGVGEEVEGGTAVADAAEAGADAAQAAKAGSAGRTAGGAGSAAGKAGSGGGASATASSIMTQAAKQSAKALAKEGLKQGRDETWNQIQNQLSSPQSPDQSGQASLPLPNTAKL